MQRERRLASKTCSQLEQNHALPGSLFGVPLPSLLFLTTNKKNPPPKQNKIPPRALIRVCRLGQGDGKAPRVYVHITARWDLKDSEEWRQEAESGRTLVFMALTNLVKSVHLAVCWKVFEDCLAKG